MNPRLVSQRERTLCRFCRMKASSCHQSATVDVKSIDGLTKVTRALESTVFPVDVDQIWNDCFPVLRQVDAKTSQDVSGFRMLPRRTERKSTLDELKHLLSTLRRLTSSLERKIPSVEADFKTMVLSLGMKSAPVEVLDNIFEMAYRKDIRMTSKLSLVNKRFRDIVMRNPRLWNKISNFTPNPTCDSLGQLQVCVKRSKNAGLDVKLELNPCWDPPDGIAILGVAVPEASRWENVYYRICHVLPNMFRDISRYSTGLNLPRLKSATLRYPRCDEDDPESTVNQSDPLMHFYTTWYMPNLTNLTVYNLFPRPFLHLAPPLTTLTLDIDEFDTDIDNELKRVYDMNLLLELLRSSPLLEIFRLHLNSFTPSTKDDDHTLPETVLPNLRTFKFTAKSLTAQSLLPFMKALRFPSLKNLHLRIVADIEAIDVGGDVWLDCALPHSYEQYMNVEVFSFEMWGFRGSDGHYDVPFAKLHNLRSLTLDTPYTKPNICKSHYEDQICMKHPKLEDIHFVRCDALDWTELMLFKRLLESQNKWDTLKVVTFKRCKMLNEEEVRVLFGGKDVTWA